MGALADEQARLQKLIDGFDPQKAGYSELSEWSAEIERCQEETELKELKWLELAERDAR